MLQPLQGREDLDRVGLGGRLPLLARDEVGQGVRVLEDRVAQAQQVAAALLERQPRPGREGPAGRLQGRARLLAIEQADLGEGLARGRAHHRLPPASSFEVRGPTRE